MKRVLILCTGNSCRSQMAEFIWREKSHGQWEAVSAGSQPSGYVHPLAIRSLAEIGMDITSGASKSVDRFRGENFDIALTVCDNARDACPYFPGASLHLHWPFDDPAEAKGTDDEQMHVFRRVRDEIAAKIQSFLNSQATGNC